MSELQKSLRILGLDPGSSKDAIQTRYKRLIMVWHPDRFPTDEGKADAEEELKKINHAKDVLFKHFESGAHRTTGCECQEDSTVAHGGASTHQQSNASSGSTTNADAEAEARRRDQERRRKASEAREKYARKQKAQEAKTTAESHSQEISEAQKRQTALKDNALRWKIAIAQVIVFFGLIGFAWSGYCLKEWWHDVSWKWEHSNDSGGGTGTGTSTDTPSYVPDLTPQNPTNTNPFGPPVAPPSDNSNMLPNGVMKPLDNSHLPVPSYTPSTTTTTTTDVPGFNWKPVTPSTPSYGDFAPKLPPTTNTSTSTDTSLPSAVDYDKYINH